MFMSYEILTTFGISAILSFTLSAAILLFLAARRGVFRQGRSKPPLVVQHAVLPPKGQGSPLLVPTAPPLPMVVELAPLKEYSP